MADTPGQRSLPEFENPPVNEVIFGIVFRKLSDFKIPYLGLLWERYKPEYPGCEEQAPLLEVAPQQVTETWPAPRIWFIHSNDSRVIQLQSDRFLFNWRKREHAYPSYKNVFPEFKRNLLAFKSFLADNALGQLELISTELTYINSIPKGDRWETLKDIQAVFPDLRWKGSQRRFLGVPQNLHWSSNFPLPDDKGELTATVRTGIRKSDQTPVLVLEFNARGGAEGLSEEAMWEWFELAHQWIVLGFEDLTSLDIQLKMWMKK